MSPHGLACQHNTQKSTPNQIFDAVKTCFAVNKEDGLRGIPRSPKSDNLYVVKTTFPSLPIVTQRIEAQLPVRFWLIRPEYATP